jgi:tetratricopeptide (TPR) repeat protein
MVGNLSMESDNFAEATTAFTKARDANPEAAMAWNGLAYAHARQRRWDEAIAAARKQTELLPSEPNPQDTLGELLFMSGQLEEAEAPFQKALTIDPKFAVAWNGIALTRAYRGDFLGARDALAKEKQAASTPSVRAGVDLGLAWLAFAEGKNPEALQTLDAIEKEPALANLPARFYAAQARAHMHYLLGKYADAQKAWDTAAKILSQAKWPQAPRQQRVMPAKAALLLAAKTGKAAEAEKAYAVLEAEAKKDASDTRLQQELVLDRGMVAWAKKDMKAVVSELANCPPSDSACQYELYLAKKMAGDVAGAEATAREITPQRDFASLWIFHQVHPQAKAPAAKSKAAPAANQ